MTKGETEPTRHELKQITPRLIEETAKHLAQLQAQQERDSAAEEALVSHVRNEMPASKDKFPYTGGMAVPYRVLLEARDMVTDISYISENLLHQPGKRTMNFIEFRRGDSSRTEPDPSKWYLYVVEPGIGWAWHLGVDDVVSVSHIQNSTINARNPRPRTVPTRTR